MQTFLPYSDFRKTAKCLDYKRLGKQRVEAWQIYQALKQGKYSICYECRGKKYKNIWNKFEGIKCFNCKETGKLKTAWYNHPIVKMWKGYEKVLLYYGYIICQEWICRGYKDNMSIKFFNAIKKNNKKLISPKWLGNKKFHASHRSNLLRKDKRYYSKFGWKEPNNLPYVWIKGE